MADFFSSRLRAVRTRWGITAGFLRINLDRLLFPVWLFIRVSLRGKKAVVIWRTAALGDVVCTLPLCVEVRRRYPGRVIVFITLRGFREVVKLSGAADLVYGIEHYYGYPSWVEWASRKCRGGVEQTFEPVTMDERTNLAVGPTRHLVDDLAQSCGFELQDRQPRLHPGAQLLADVQARFGLREAMARGQTIIGINGGHTWPVREWSGPKWQALVNLIAARYDARILQFGVPGVGDETDHLAGVHSLVGKLSSVELIALIASCRVVVSIDSGPVHVAGAVGTPVVGLFGAVNPLFRLPPESPASGIVADVPCLFCHHRTPIEHWKTGCPYDIRCMKLLEPESVFAAINDILAPRPNA
jgi:ADP-heptose:LPS heptosyltransferase